MQHAKQDMVDHSFPHRYEAVILSHHSDRFLSIFLNSFPAVSEFESTSPRYEEKCYGFGKVNVSNPQAAYK